MLEPEEKPRIVIADEDEAFAASLASMLEADGRVETIGIASNGEEAVQLALWHDPDVVLLDAAMPRIGCLEATRLVRESRPRLCILMVSGEESEELRGRALEAGAAGVFAKRRIPRELIDRILDLVSARELRPGAD